MRWALFLLVTLSACIKTPSPQDLENADYGPFPADYENMVKNAMAPVLFDPYSAMYHFGGTYRGYYNKSPLIGGGIGEYGFFVPVAINAKNRFGGYTGAKSYLFFLKNGRVLSCSYAGLIDVRYCQ